MYKEQLLLFEPPRQRRRSKPEGQAIVDAVHKLRALGRQVYAAGHAHQVDGKLLSTAQLLALAAALPEPSKTGVAAAEPRQSRSRRPRIARLLEICEAHATPVVSRLGDLGRDTPAIGSSYQPEFLQAFRELCRIYKESKCPHPDAQVLTAMLDHGIRPCRAARFSLAIVRRLGKGIL